jgi:transcriptional regulator with XRE-family HTH domain
MGRCAPPGPRPLLRSIYLTDILAGVNATALQDDLRNLLWERIRAKKLTGLGLARQTGFEQAYISNFLNRKRSLSLEGMDRVLAAQNLSIYDLLDPDEVNKRASSIAAGEGNFDNVVLTDADTAAKEPVIRREAVRDVLKFKRTFLKRLRPASSKDREAWQRFVLIKVDAQEATSMYPRLLPSATVLIDRHYNLLQPYRRNQSNIYAVRKGQGCTIKYVERSGDHLVLRPHNQLYPVSVLPLDGREASEMIVGRICHVAIET